VKFISNSIDNNIGDNKLSKIDCNFKVKTAALPVLRSVERTSASDFRIGFFADLHSGHANLLKIAALRQSLKLDLFASIGDLTEGGQYPAQLFAMINVLNDLGLAFNVIGNHFFDFEDRAIRSGTMALLEELKSSAKACLTNDPSYRTPGMTLLLTIKRLKEQLIQEAMVRAFGKNIVLDQAIRMANFPLLSLNLEFEPGSTLERQVGQGILPYYIHYIYGRKIAFIGVTTETINHEFGHHKKMGYESTVSVKEEPLEDQVRTTIQELDADNVILASHLGFLQDIEMASSIPEIDLVLGSHTHNITHKQVVHQDGKAIPIIYTGIKGAALGIVDVNFNGDGRMESTPYIIDMDAQPKVRVPSVFNYRPRVVGKLEHPLSLKYKSTQPIPLMNFISDSYREHTGTDIALAIAGDVRAGLPAGEITETDIEEMLPWPSELSIIKSTGQEIINILQFAADVSYYGSGRTLLFHPSGLKYSVNKEGKIENVSILREGSYIPIQPDESYTVTIPEYLAKDGIPGLSFQAIRKNNTTLTNKEIILYQFSRSGVTRVDEKVRIKIDPESDRLYNNPDITY